MTSAGTKALVVLSLASLVMGVALTFATGDRLGVALFFTAVAAFGILASAITASAGVGDRVALIGASGSASRPTSASFGPVLVALGAGVLVLGAALGVVAYAFGAALAGFGSLMWFSSTWREHPVHKPKVTDRVTQAFTTPVGMPIAVMGFILLVAISVSRALLAASKAGSAWVAIIVALSIFGGGIVAASLPRRTSRSLYLSVVVLFVLAVMSIGVVGLVKGERKFGEHEENKGGSVAATSSLPVSTSAPATP